MIKVVLASIRSPSLAVPNTMPYSIASESVIEMPLSLDQNQISVITRLGSLPTVTSTLVNTVSPGRDWSSSKEEERGPRTGWGDRIGQHRAVERYARSDGPS